MNYIHTTLYGALGARVRRVLVRFFIIYVSVSVMQLSKIFLTLLIYIFFALWLNNNALSAARSSLPPATPQLTRQRHSNKNPSTFTLHSTLHTMSTHTLCIQSVCLNQHC